MARALDLHSRGQGFDSLILHERVQSNKATKLQSGKVLVRKKVGKTQRSKNFEINGYAVAHIKVVRVHKISTLNR